MKRIVTLTGVVAVWFAAAASHAQTSDYPPALNEKFKIDDRDPENHLPSKEEMDKNPLEWGYLLMTFDERAQIAIQRNNWEQALKYHRAAAKLVPDRAVSFALVCKDYEMLGKREEALEACGVAVALPGARLDYFVSFVHLVAQREGGVDAGEAKDALEAIAHLKANESTKLAAYELQCDLGLKMRDDALLDECSRELLVRAPKAPRPTTFAWALALQRGDTDLAKKLIDEARQKGASEASLTKMERATTAVVNGAALDSPSAGPAPYGAAGGIRNGNNDDSGKPGGGGRTLSGLASAWGSMNQAVKWLLGFVAVLLCGFLVVRKLPRSAA
jgi:tetratricopeptide (TPR) repeat protein